MSRDRIVLYSGGPDSYITYHEVDRLYGKGSRIIPVYFLLQQRACDRELAAIAQTLPETAQIRTLEGLGYWEEPDHYIYQRNAFLTLAATRISKSSVVYLTLQKDEFSVPDRRPEFIDSINALFKTLEIDSSVQSLWLEKDKTEMFQHFASKGGRIEDLSATWSCYDPRVVSSNRMYAVMHCGSCAACIRRYVAFYNAFGTDLTPYKEFPPRTTTASEYVRRAREGKYSSVRSGRILAALENAKV